MPDPKKYESEDKWMAACVPKMVEEGRGQDQAVAACLNMWRRKEASDPFLVWKEADGTYRWLAVYSSKFRDDDNPPEILAESAHKEFVDAVDKGEWPMPELWLWHVKGTRSGAADYVAYDDSGFAIASGTFDQGRERIASRLAERDDLATSHGMPVVEIRRDEADSSIITRYRTREISALPRWAAANKNGTGFLVLSKEADMAIPEKKRQFLTETMGEDAAEDLERQLEGKAQELKDQGVEFKEAEPGPEQVEETKDEPEAAVAPDAPAPEEVPGPQYVTHDELTDVFGGHVKPLVDAVAALVAQVEALGKEVKEQQNTIKALKASDEEKVKAVMEQTPAASLFSRIGSAIGSDEAAIDGRSALAKSKPKSVETGADGPTYVPWLNDLIAKQVHGG